MRASLSLLMAGAVLAAPASASAATLECGSIVTASTTLRADLVDCPGDGLVIGADNITLDLKGHTLDGVAAARGRPGRAGRAKRVGPSRHDSPAGPAVRPVR